MKNSNRFYHPLHPNPFPISAPEITKQSVKKLDYLRKVPRQVRDLAFSIEQDTWLKSKPSFSETCRYLGRLLSELSYDRPEFSEHYFTVGAQIGHMACRGSFIGDESELFLDRETGISRLDTSRERVHSIVELDPKEASDWLDITEAYHQDKAKKLQTFVSELVTGDAYESEHAYIKKGALFAYSALSFEWLRLKAEEEAAYQEANRNKNEPGGGIIHDIMLPHKKQISGRFRLP